jgi:hypothetical protein
MAKTRGPILESWHYPQVTRVEVITSDGGRAYVNWVMRGVMFQVQDEGRTLKVFEYIAPQGEQ